MKIIATKIPIGVNATLTPSAASGAPSQPSFCAKQRGQRDAGNRGRQREGNIDDGIEQPATWKTVANQRPDNDRSHHQIDKRRSLGEAK